MTSIAAYLAGLTGGAPKEGQKTSEATVPGASGLFADLLVSTDGKTAATGASITAENPHGLVGDVQLPGVDGLSVEVSTQSSLTEIAGSAQTEITVSDPELGKILTDGLAQVPGDVEAGITVSTETGNVIADGETPAVDADAEEATPDVVPAQAETTETVDADVSLAVPAAAISVTPEAETDQPEAEAEAENETAVPATVGGTSQTQPQAQTTGEPRNKGLENALQRASHRGQQNGLQNALSQAPQAKANGQAQATASDGKPQGVQTGASEAESNRPQVTVSEDADASIRTREGRAVLAARDVSTFQRILDAGNGKKVIQINERIGGEAAGTVSPPTLTVNVSASAASPGPASPNTPHVPVSALAVHIAQQFKNGARRFNIRLDPPELGRIDVRLDVSRDGQVSTHLVVERSETLDLLQRDARQLERALQDAGLDTSKDDMKFSLKDQGLAQDGQEEFARNENETPASSRGIANDQAEIMDDAMPPPTRYLATAGLDIRI